MSANRPATDESERLIEDALSMLRQGDAERALWRLVDAAGLIKAKCFINPRAIGTKHMPTGRGYFIDERTA